MNYKFCKTRREKILISLGYLIALNTTINALSSRFRFSEEDQRAIVYDLWTRENKENGSWINFAYCCDGCDGSFPFDFNDLLSEIGIQISKISAECTEV